MSDDQFTKLFKYIEEFRAEFREHAEESRVKHKDIYGAVGELSAQVRDYHNESLALSHQFDKLREAILQIARETGVKLSVEL